ncbi:MAG: hemolysin III family protein [Pirellulales bacterium]|nr:hemolysin III family protein [Pirellulales bacterium]
MQLTAMPGFADPFSSLTHLLGAGVFFILGIFLIRRGAGNTARVCSLVIFVLGSVLLLSISGVYHLLDPGGEARQTLRILDHAAIFILIACSFTPPHIIMFRGPQRWGVLLLVWAFAVAAITLKCFYFREMPTAVGLGMYLGMGWIGLIGGVAMWRQRGFAFIAPIFWGGIAYSIGAIMEYMNWPTVLPGVIQPHEVFHVAVLIGLALHWSFIFTIADGRLSPGPALESAAADTCPAPLRGR